MFIVVKLSVAGSAIFFRTLKCAAADEGVGFMCFGCCYTRANQRLGLLLCCQQCDCRSPSCAELVAGISVQQVGVQPNSQGFSYDLVPVA